MSQPQWTHWPVDVDVGGVHGLSPGDGGLPQARLRLLQHLQRVPEPDQHPFTPQVRLHLHQFIALQRRSNKIISNRARHFSNWCDVYEEAKVVHRNWWDNHCNRSDTGPSMLLPELYQQPPCSLPWLEHTHTHTQTDRQTECIVISRERERATDRQTYYLPKIGTSSRVFEACSDTHLKRQTCWKRQISCQCRSAVPLHVFRSLLSTYSKCIIQHNYLFVLNTYLFLHQ